jgi:carboxylesterase type B
MIFGESAGAGSMTNHLSMPKSAGLFSSVTLESGAFATWTAQPMNISQETFAEVMIFTGCETVGCLRTLPAANLTLALNHIAAGRCCALAGNPWIPWAPAIDGVELTAHPYKLLLQGKVNKPAAILHGTNKDEGASFEPLPETATKDDLTNAFTKWCVLLSLLFGLNFARVHHAQRRFFELTFSVCCTQVRCCAWTDHRVQVRSSVHSNRLSTRETAVGCC